MNNNPLYMYTKYHNYAFYLTYMLNKMHNCDICYNSYITLNILRCCKGKRICIKCMDKYGKLICPFCRQLMNRKLAIVIDNKNNIPEKGEIILSVMNYNIIEIW